MEGSYNTGVESNPDSTGVHDDHPSSSKTHRHSSHKHRHSSHSNKDGHHRHSNPGHDHHHHRKQQDEMHAMSLNNDGDVAPSPVAAENNQGRAEKQQHDATKSGSGRPSSGLAQSTPPESAAMARSNKVTLAQSAPPYSHPIDIDATAHSSEEEEDETPNVKRSSNAIDKEVLAVPVVAVQPVSTVPTTTTTTTTAASPSTVTRSSILAMEPRQGRLCCNCCCDFRRAVIIVNIVIIVIEIIALILVATGSLSAYLYGEDTSSNTLGKYETIEMIFSGVSILLCGIAIGGALFYNNWLVALNILWLVVGFILGIVLSLQYCDDYCNAYDGSSSSCECGLSGFTVFVAAVFMVLWIYPHAGFIMEVREGTMSEETYAREEYSCCCV